MYDRLNRGTYSPLRSDTSAKSTPLSSSAEGLRNVSGSLGGISCVCGMTPKLLLGEKTMACLGLGVLLHCDQSLPCGAPRALIG